VAQVAVDLADKVSFSKALRSVLRHDPDVVMIGESAIGKRPTWPSRLLDRALWCSARCTPIPQPARSRDWQTWAPNVI